MIILVGVGVLGTRVLKRLSEYEEVLLIDYDTVEEKNIRRQYPAEALGMHKIEAARKYIRGDVRVLHKHIDWSTAGVLHDAEVVIDCTDNMLARYVINDYCAKYSIPWIHAGVSDTAGSVVAILPDGPCYQCVYPRGIGEACSQELDLAFADETAKLAVEELVRLRAEHHARFLRVTKQSHVALSVSPRKGCPTCAGDYHYLQPHDYYITFCTNAGCMSAKPVHPHHHDTGVGKATVVDGIAVIVYPNGEIHFSGHSNDDTLRDVAEKIYDKQFRKRAA